MSMALYQTLASQKNDSKNIQDYLLVRGCRDGVRVDGERGVRGQIGTGNFMKQRNPIDRMLDGAINREQKELREKMEKAKAEIMFGHQVKDNYASAAADHAERLAK
jgi:hypothetical protein